MLAAESEQDVVAGVRLARERGWQVSVRSGGHSWAGWSVRDDALLIDLGDMREHDLDGEVARRGPAVKGGLELAPFLAERGRLFTGGHCESVGLGGFLLQGGQGWNSRRWGWGCENVLGVDVVTADGELVHATRRRTPTSTGPRAAPVRASPASSPAFTCARTSRCRCGMTRGLRSPTSSRCSSSCTTCCRGSTSPSSR